MYFLFRCSFSSLSYPCCKLIRKHSHTGWKSPAGDEHLPSVLSLSLPLHLHISVFFLPLPLFAPSSLGWEERIPMVASCFKCADFIIRSESNSCDQAGFFLVGIAYCFGTPFFLPPLISITSSFFSASATLPFYFSKPLASSLFRLPRSSFALLLLVSIRTSALQLFTLVRSHENSSGYVQVILQC